MDNSAPLFMAAPMQGLTTWRWRQAHAAVCGDLRPLYFTPFVRVERGAVRRHDLRDVELDTVGAVPQVICADAAELAVLADTLADMCHRRIDINMGCPFPPQMRHGRGAGLMGRREALEGIAAEVCRRTGMRFSLKMRLGVDDAGQWRSVMPAVNDMPLAHVTLHARTTAMGYSGEPLLDLIDEFCSLCRHHVVLNGNIADPATATALMEQHKGLRGVMAGRGLLMRPSLPLEMAGGRSMPLPRRVAMAVEVHRATARSYMSDGLCDDRVALRALVPVLPYLLEGASEADDEGRRALGRALKAARKSHTLQQYDDALSAAMTTAAALSPETHQTTRIHD